MFTFNIFSILSVIITPLNGQATTLNINPVSREVLRDVISSEAACHKKIEEFADQNTDLCVGGDGTGDVTRVIKSHWADHCRDQTICNLKFQCNVLEDYKTCTKDFLQQNLGGEFRLLCPRSSPYVAVLNEGEPATGLCFGVDSMHGVLEEDEFTHIQTRMAQMYPPVEAHSEPSSPVRYNANCRDFLARSYSFP